MIMVGPGTGVAPFRGFLQEREATGATGKNWLFFGGRSLYHDFLYQLEWQQALKRKSLHRVDVAFSGDDRRKRSTCSTASSRPARNFCLAAERRLFLCVR